MDTRSPAPRTLGAALVAVLALALVAGPALGANRSQPASASASGSAVVLSWNDLGMHCMNKDHANFSVLPPYNNLFAQVIRRGDATHLPQLLASGVTVEYSVPGNSWSAGKTDFWTWTQPLFGVTLPPDVGLTGKGLTGTLDPSGTMFSAHGIPVTPWPDADLANEHPYQQALVIARDAVGAELARSTPVIPVSTELNCVGSGCHASENAILNGHPREAGFDPSARPILCAKCHADPVLGTTGIREAGYFSFRMHDQHKFMDEQSNGTALCYRCHPGPKTQCLRGAMNTLHGQQCQNCHGGMAAMASSIEHGRVPWVQEPRCADCHTAAYAENPGTLFRNSTGHGGIACEGCHGSTHADLPSREAADNANNIALQGYAATLRECAVCHGITPAGAGPHGAVVAGVENPAFRGAPALRVSPNPMRAACSIDVPRADEPARLLVYDANGRIVRSLDTGAAGRGGRVAWDGTDYRGARVGAGVYFVRWQSGDRVASGRVTVIR
jgi:hypothetical protein